MLTSCLQRKQDCQSHESNVSQAAAMLWACQEAGNNSSHEDGVGSI